MTDQAKPGQPALMDGQTYFDLCDRLIAAHPEDLINIISRVLEQRADVEHIRTEPEAGSGTTSIETGQFKVPGCPGARDCTDPMHADGHLVIADRLFSIAIRGQQLPIQGADHPRQSGPDHVCHGCSKWFFRNQVVLVKLDDQWQTRAYYCYTCDPTR